MNFHYSNCIDQWEKIFFWIHIIAFFIVVISGFLLFNRQNDPEWKSDKKGVFLVLFTGALLPLFTTKYLNPKAVKYRWLFLGSIAILFINAAIHKQYPICSTDPKKIRVVVDDCGPLARGELGVVFSLAPGTLRKKYFAKGSAMDICPKLVNAKYVVGYEKSYCENYEPFDPKECEYAKVFVIKEYVHN